MNLDNLTSAIAKLETINPTDEYAYETALLAFTTIKNLPIFIYEIPAGQKVCRARTHDTAGLFKNISEISTPPYSSVKEFARCNRPFQAKFYGAETRPTSFMEMLEYWVKTKKFGEKLYVTTGLWRTKKSLFAIIITSPDAEKRTTEFDIHHGQKLDEFINRYSGEFKEAMILFYRFLFEKFRKPAKHDLLTYIITTAYCNLALAEAKGQANCIYYPSVPFNGQGINFAINADFITTDNIEILGAMCNEMTVSKNEENKHSFTETNHWYSTEIIEIENKIKWN